MNDYIFEMEGIGKSFNGVKVLDNVSIQIKRGEVHSLVGGNGAGKSTLMKIFTGVYTKDEGVIRINGKEVEISDPIDANKHGVRMIFQELSLIPTMSVSENIFLNQKSKKKGLGLIDSKELDKKARELLRRFCIDIEPRTIVNELGVGCCQLIEILKALSLDAEILIMDEPTASLTDAETSILFDIISKLKENGVTIIYISHRMNEIFKVSDSITVLKDGKKVVTMPAKDYTMKSIIDYMIGSEVEKKFERINREKKIKKEAMLEVKNLSINESIQDISFTLQKGEILGIAGLMGSGRTEILETLFGIRKKKSGEVVLDGKKLEIRNVKDAINAGLALIPEDRRREGLVLMHSLRNNILLPIMDNMLKGIMLNDKKINETINESVKELDIKTDGINKTASLLSGGNQQKIVIAKWLRTNPKVLMMDEPTAGVDIGAKGEIVDIVRRFSNADNSVILVSSETAELIALCDRILVLKDGRVAGEIYGEEISSEEGLQHAIQQ